MASNRLFSFLELPTVSHYPVLLLTKNSDEDHHPVEGRVAACWTPCDVPENCVGGSSWLIGGGPLSNGESFGAPHPIRSSESHNDMAENGTLKSNLSRGQLSSRNSGVTWAQSTNLGTDNDPPHGRSFARFDRTPSAGAPEDSVFREVEAKTS
ncbi:hypothetical protein QR680_008871 [Steinernema hermaphroditum]|uniref:Uncharacterized protein n=1 Tax=Steinernema hermaphroditum TaxID=289476 RepID=A0AA39II96_9BILA|nr:hypothetical protein QR680_008871 [Steinernema hermaphroditum]